MMQSRQKWPIILFSIGVFMAALDNGIITAALTTLIHSFNISTSWGAWSITLYTLGLAISVPIVGKLSDRFGRKRLFLIEIALFTLGSLLVALSPNFTLFLVSRFVQAMGGGGIFIIANSYVLSTFPKKNQGRALGMLGGMNGIAAVLGPNIGAFILDITGSWHWLFLINIPIGILLVTLGLVFLEESSDAKKSALDYTGIGLLMVAVLSLMYGLTNLKGTNLLESFALPEVYGFILLGVVLTIILLYVEKRIGNRGGDPVLPIGLLSLTGYRWALILGFLSGGILASVIFIPAFVEQFFGISSTKAGYWFTPLAIASGIGAGGGGAITDRKGPIFTLVLAAVFCIVGFLLFPLWVEQPWQMIVASCLVGFGFGTMLGAPINMLATEQSESSQGAALGTLSLIRQIGMTLMPTIYAGFLARSFTGLGERITAKFTEAGYAAGEIQGQMGEWTGDADFQTMMTQLDQIPIPQVRDILKSAVHDAVASGFNGLFVTAAIVSVLALVATFLTGAIRNKRLASKQMSAQNL